MQPNVAKQRIMDAEPQTIWAASMFYLSLGFLALVAAITVLWIDVPRVTETTAEMEIEEVAAVDALQDAMGDGTALTPEQTAAEERFERSAFAWGARCGILLLLLWPIFITEQVVRLIRSETVNDYWSNNPFGWLICLFPPLRMCEREREGEDRIWLPWGGWQLVDRQLRRNLERRFSVPMVGIALLILPVLGLQFYFQERILLYPALRFLLHFGTGLIWFAFTVEFIVMVSVSDKKIQYCKKHWLDLLIILLPLVSFLRSLRIIRATKLVKVGKLQQLTRVVRVYRLRGVLMRTLRALMLLEIIHRIIPTSPEKKLRKLEEEYEDRLEQLEDLREEIAALRTELEQAASQTN